MHRGHWDWKRHTCSIANAENVADIASAGIASAIRATGHNVIGDPGPATLSGHTGRSSTTRIHTDTSDEFWYVVKCRL